MRHLYQVKNVLQSIGCLPPLGPGSGGPRLMPPHEWPVQPLSLFTFVFLLFSHSSLCRTAEKKTEMWSWTREVEDTLNIFTVTSILSLNNGVLQYVGSNYFDCIDKKNPSMSNANVLLYGSTLFSFHLLLLRLAPAPNVPNNPSLQNWSIQTRPEESSMTCGVNKTKRTNESWVFLCWKNIYGATPYPIRP